MKCEGNKLMSACELRGAVQELDLAEKGWGEGQVVGVIEKHRRDV